LADFVNLGQLQNTASRDDLSVICQSRPSFAVLSRRPANYISAMRFEKVWVEQCRATKAIKRRFGAKSALDYLVGEKLITFADAAREHPTFARELPKFLAAIWQVFNEYEIAGYVVSQRPFARKRLRQLLYFR
jgi:hypothetical protein